MTFKSFRTQQIAILSALFVLTITGIVSAQDIPEAPVVDTSVKDTSDSIGWFPWEKWDPVTGKVSHSMSDLSFPGNGLPITVSRYYEFGLRPSGFTEDKIGIDVPRLVLGSTNIANDRICQAETLATYNQNGYSGSVTGSQIISPLTWRNGGTKIRFFSTASIAHPINQARFPDGAIAVSPSNWYITCNPNNAAAFVVHAPNGMTYTHSAWSTGHHATDQYRSKSQVFVSSISDQNANTLNYTYNMGSVAECTHIDEENFGCLQGYISTEIKNLSTISDGDRLIEFSFSNEGRALTIAGNGSPNPRTVNYTATHLSLTVTHEDAAFYGYKWHSNGQLKSVQLPTGGKITYTYDPSMALKKRTISNSGSEDGDVDYNFSGHRNDTRTRRTITTPTSAIKYWVKKSRREERYVNADIDSTYADQGKIYLMHRYSNPQGSGHPEYVQETEWEIGDPVVDIAAVISTNPLPTIGIDSPENFPNAWIAYFDAFTVYPKKITTTMRSKNGNDIVFVRETTDRDDYGRPIAVTATSNLDNKRDITKEYRNISTPWINGLLKKNTIKDSDGVTHDETVQTYDDIGRLSSVKRNNVVEANYTYHGNGRLHTDKNGEQHTHTYGSYYRGSVKTETNRDGKHLSREINSDGTIANETRWGADDLWLYAYDSSRRLASIQSPRTATSITTISWPDRNTRSSSQSNYNTSHKFDGFGRLLFDGANDTNSGKWVSTSYRYDGQGRLVKQSYPTHKSTDTDSTGIDYTYDGLDRITNINQPGDSRDISYLYNDDSNGDNANPFRVTEVNGEDARNTTFFESFGSPAGAYATSQQNARQITSTYTRDLVGRLTQISRDGLTRSFGYNANKQLSYETHPENGTTSYPEYFGDGMLKRSTLGGINTVYTYNGLNQLKTAAFGNGSGNHVTREYNYYDTGDLQDITTSSADDKGSDNNTTVSYAYDVEGNITSETLSIGSLPTDMGLSYEYDNLSNLSHRTFPTQQKYNYSPDAFGRATKIESITDNTVLFDSISYHGNGQVHEISGPGGSYSRKLFSNLLPEKLQTSISSGNYGQSYTYDDAGNTKSITHLSNNQQQTLKYDMANRLTESTGSPTGNWTFTYDNRDNITSYTRDSVYQSFGIDQTKNRITSLSLGSRTLSYDNRGNMTNTGLVQPSFSAANQIYRASENGKTYFYGYDGNGRRVREQEGTLVDYFFYDAAGVHRYRYGSNHQVQSEYHTIGGQLFARRDFQDGVPAGPSEPPSNGGGGGGGGNTAPCIDDDGDGYGWNGTESCDPSGGGSGDNGGSGDGGNSNNSDPLCVDDDGDGYGWNGFESCDPSGNSSSSGDGHGNSDDGSTNDNGATCVDTAPIGDGWGWNGSASCQISASDSGGGGNGSSDGNDAPCIDHDGDGYGWNGTASCIP